MGSPYRAVEMETREDLILERRDRELEPLTVPGDAIALTAGIDVQKRGFWYVVFAWRADLSNVLIDYWPPDRLGFRPRAAGNTLRIRIQQPQRRKEPCHLACGH